MALWLPLSRRFFLFTALILVGSGQAALVARAQTADVTALREPEFLDMTWLVNPGDNPAYARPDFDDSSWIRFQPDSSITRACSQTVVVWYRLHVKTDPTVTGLALSARNISRAFEIYVNGQRLIASGRVAPFEPYSSNAWILARIPDRMAATGSLVIAMRVHITDSEWATVQDPGFYATNLKIGQYNTLYRDNWLSIIGENAVSWFDRLLLISLGFVALALFASQRCRSEYLWIFAVGALTLLESPFPVLSAFVNLPAFPQLLSNLPRLASPFLWATLYFSFVHQRIGWRWRIFLAFAGIMNFVSFLHGLYFNLPAWLSPFANLPFIALLSVVVPIVLAIHWRRGNREAGILLIPSIFFSLYIYAEVVLAAMFEFSACREAAIRGINLIDRYPLGPFTVSLDNVSGILCSLSLAVIMILRSSTMSRRQAQIEAELEAAQQVQQVLVPERPCMLVGFKIDSVYQPAQQVGGDFFQVLSTEDGGMLLVAGDVAGKGLPAAMLVSVLVGAIRGIADYTSSPAEILGNLNERLLGRAGGGFSTAVAAHISANGSVAIANAGHLPPYLDGEELDLPGALPLGVVEGAEYETTYFNLPEGCRLTFFSDGVVEAQNQKGELFGFERSRALAMQPASVIADSARRFGQQDDITVVIVHREHAAVETELACVPELQNPLEISATTN
jgi:phosphoserine phosphatase RsbU/P